MYETCGFKTARLSCTTRGIPIVSVLSQAIKDDLQYGNIGCGISSSRLQNQIIFWPKIRTGPKENVMSFER